LFHFGLPAALDLIGFSPQLLAALAVAGIALAREPRGTGALAVPASAQRKLLISML
jgi:hypothetical protein